MHVGYHASALLSRRELDSEEKYVMHTSQCCDTSLHVGTYADMGEFLLYCLLYKFHVLSKTTLSVLFSILVLHSAEWPVTREEKNLSG